MSTADHSDVQAVLAGQATWALVEADCLGPAGTAALPDQSCDHVITDPPYSEHVTGNSMRGAGHRPGGAKRALGFVALAQQDMRHVADQSRRLTRRWSLVFCAVEQVSDWASAFTMAQLDYLRTCCWVKIGATPQFTGDRPAAGFEALVCCHPPGRKRWNGGGKLGVYHYSTAHQADDQVQHTTQKPLALMLALVRDFTDPGDIILDPFAGSGTTGVAALQLGRRFIGYEREPRYCAAARRRLAGAREQLELVAVTRRSPARQAALWPKESA